MSYVLVKFHSFSHPFIFSHAKPKWAYMHSLPDLNIKLWKPSPIIHPNTWLNLPTVICTDTTSAPNYLAEPNAQMGKAPCTDPDPKLALWKPFPIIRPNTWLNLPTVICTDGAMLHRLQITWLNSNAQIGKAPYSNPAFPRLLAPSPIKLPNTWLNLLTVKWTWNSRCFFVYFEMNVKFSMLFCLLWNEREMHDDFQKSINVKFSMLFCLLWNEREILDAFFAYCEMNVKCTMVSKFTPNYLAEPYAQIAIGQNANSASLGAAVISN